MKSFQWFHWAKKFIPSGAMKFLHCASKWFFIHPKRVFHSSALYAQTQLSPTAPSFIMKEPRITAQRNKVTSECDFFEISILMYLSVSVVNIKRAFLTQAQHTSCFSFKALHHCERVTTSSNLGLFPWKILPACPWTLSLQCEQP